jgi:hypothetical protein
MLHVIRTSSNRIDQKKASQLHYYQPGSPQMKSSQAPLSLGIQRIK